MFQRFKHYFSVHTFEMLAAKSLSWFLVLGALGAGSLAEDAENWYKTHPGMPHIKKVNQDSHQIVDEYGRTRFFHGTNVVMKEAPWYRPMEWTPGVSSFGEKDVQMMHDLGLNIVRLGHSWAGAEPERGSYNQTFLDIMKQQTKLAEEQGIYVLVDVHQDVLAKQLCGHGVPDVSRILKKAKKVKQDELTRVSGLSRKIGSRALGDFPFLSNRHHLRPTIPAFQHRSRFATQSTGR